jgi:hypothetical protein
LGYKGSDLPSELPYIRIAAGTARSTRRQNYENKTIANFVRNKATKNCDNAPLNNGIRMANINVNQPRSKGPNFFTAGNSHI